MANTWIDIGELSEGWVNGSGTISPLMDGSMCTGFISVEPGQDYTYQFDTPKDHRLWSRCCWYGEDRKLLGEMYYITGGGTSYDRTTTVTRTAPANAAYVRLSALWMTSEYGGEMRLLRAGGGGSMISDPIQLFVLEDSIPGWVDASGTGTVDPISPQDARAKERSGAVRDAKPGQKFCICIDCTVGAAETYDHAWCGIGFYDKDMVLLWRPAYHAANGVGHMEFEATAPANTAYVRPTARFYDDGFLSLEASGGGSGSMTTFADGIGRNLAMGSAGPNGQCEYFAWNIGELSAPLATETQYITISFDLVMTIAKADPYLSVYNTNNKGPLQLVARNSGAPVKALDGETHEVGETISKRYAFNARWVPRSNADKTSNYIEFYSGYNTGNKFTLSNLMVELGDVAHPYRPAPEDTEQPSDVVYASEGVDLGDTSGLVESDGVIAAINVSGETARISGSRIEVTGEAVFSAINGDTSTTKINGGKIDADTLHVKAANIDGSLTIGKVDGLQGALDGKADDADVTAAISTASADATAKANDAAKTATNYISIDPDDGIRIADANPVTATTYQHQTATSTEFMVDGESRMLISGDGQRIGKEYIEGATDNESHMELDYHSLQMIDKEGNAYFHVSDLREADGSTEITETFDGNGTLRTFTVAFGVSAEVSATDSSDASNTVTRTGQRYVFTHAPASGATVTIVYKSMSDLLKGFTFGSRKSGSHLGALSVAEGYLATASGDYSHAEGSQTTASGAYSHAEGSNAAASGDYSHAEGSQTTASGDYSHAEGYQTTASGDYSHAEGDKTTASGFYSHAEGYQTTTRASAFYSHAQNYHTIAASDGQTAMGKYNIEDNNGDYALIIGNGTADDARSNALAVTWDGDIETAKDTAWITLNSAIKYRIHHGVCYVCGDSVSGGTNVGTSETSVGTLPVEARPSVTVSGAASTKSNTDNGQYAIDSFGVIKVWNLRTNSPYWCFTTSYPVG